MKSTGIVRKLDELGRIVLPVEIRNNMDLKTRDSVEIFVEEDRIILKKYHPSCTFCDKADDLQFYMGKLICRECIHKLSGLN